MLMRTPRLSDEAQTLLLGIDLQTAATGRGPSLPDSAARRGLERHALIYAATINANPFLPKVEAPAALKQWRPTDAGKELAHELRWR